jgi:hypothetical protein
LTDANGNYSLHVADGQAVKLTAFRRGDPVVGPVDVPAATATQNLAFGPVGLINVSVIDEGDQPLPARVQIRPSVGDPPELADKYGEPGVTAGRLHVDYEITGDITLQVPVGEWEVIVSRGYEYEAYQEIVTVNKNETIPVSALMEHSVDTTGIMCGDFHIHTNRSPDTPDDPVIIAELGLEEYAFGVGSVELTSFQAWGHMGVVPLTADPTKQNNGAPKWMTHPTKDDLTIPTELLEPAAVFDTVRTRPEEPVMIINHPRGGTEYFSYVGYDPITGLVDKDEAWDEKFVLVEVFNDSDWLENLDDTVKDWLSFLNFGRRVYAVGSSDSHKIRTSPVGYPRTCMDFGSDDPTTLSPNIVRDTLAAGKSTISGGIYMTASVGGVGPGGDATGLGATANVDIVVQAALWVDVDTLEIIVDGVSVATIAILPEDADAGNPVIRYQASLPIDVAANGGYVIVVAYGDEELEPVHPGRRPFGVTNPIFLSR